MIRSLAGGLGAALIGAAAGLLAWRLWWPHTDLRAGVGLIAMIAFGLIGLLLVATTLMRGPGTELRRWPAALAFVVVAIASYAWLVIVTVDACGPCPPWSSAPTRTVTIQPGQPGPPVLDERPGVVFDQDLALDAQYEACAIGRGFDPMGVQTLVGSGGVVFVKTGLDVPASVHGPCFEAITRTASTASSWSQPVLDG